MWDQFWEYVISYWIRVVGVKSWNICVRLGEYLEIQQRANNSLECYNREYGRKFPKRPSLIKFVKVSEAESRDQEERLRTAQKHHSQRRKYKDPKPPEDAIPEAYHMFAAAEKKRMKKAAKNKARGSR